MTNALDLFSLPTRTWFAGAFGEPTLAQDGAWRAIAEGKHALVVAPTGSGKTLAAFLWALDQLHQSDDQLSLLPDVAPKKASSGTKVLYISPLKALGVDVERNLRAPLIGIGQTAKRLGLTPPEVSVGVRSGDTPPKERRALISNPPEILITTPESLYLMLTSKARSTLTQVHTVIIDEVHAVAGTKRGAHLAVTLERLDQILETPAQRVGLSATVEPVSTVARFLGGTAPVEVVQPPSQKEWDLKVSVPVPDMTVLGRPNGAGAPGSGPAETGTAEGVYSPVVEKMRADYDEQVFAFDSGKMPFDDGLDIADSLVLSETSTVEKLPQVATVADLLGIKPLSEPLGPVEEQDGGVQPGTEELGELDPAESAPLETAVSQADDNGAGGYQASIWPYVEERIVDLVEANRSTIVFTNSRGLSEKLTARLNEIYTDRLLAREEADRVAGKIPEREVSETAADALAAALAHGARKELEKDDERLRSKRTPAQTMGPAATAQGAPPVLARAHHGSVSKDQRTLIEEALKSGQLKCVVATSSLELGIDMGAVDLVIQVESPFSVASGLQRVGRAGHQVGEVSHGYLYPKHRGDLLLATVTVDRMLKGHIEPLNIPANPLDILAQQTVAACALGPIDANAWFEALRHTAPFATLPLSAFEATLDLLAGKYPSDEFAELRPRITWDRDTNTIEGRPGAQRIAVTSGGTIPDRGLFPVFIAGGEESKAPKRVGELDEEMVYESRSGDVIALGASSWRIEDISHDRVTVTPAPGIPGKLPFWHGEGSGRPVDLGKALGAFTRELGSQLTKNTDKARSTLTDIGLDTWAADNLEAYVREQQEATGVLPSDKQLLVERFRDEIGDWRVVLHSPYGIPVHAPWALAVGARVEEKYGVNASAMAADDGIVLRIPSIESEPPGMDLFLFDADELEALVGERVGASALFASRFRESAARALLLPRKDPGRRTPLWQQRQRSAQLLDVARKYPTFPILLETARECLQDVYDLPALMTLTKDLDSKAVKLSEIETETPSPFARTLLFGYVAQFLYEGDSPLAERRAAALTLDPTLLAELLGKDELRELLDADVIRSTEARLQHTDPDYRYKGLEGTADLLRLLGLLTAPEVALRLRVSSDDPSPVSEAQAQAYLDELVERRRALKLNLQGRDVYAAIEDAARIRDALGVPLPMGVPLTFLEEVPNPLQDLVARYARTHAPFTPAQAAHALGLGTAVVQTALEALATERRVISGEFLPEEIWAEFSMSRTGTMEAAGTEWVDSGVLKTLRARSLAALRQDVEPVPGEIYGLFLPPWQHVGTWEITEEHTAPGTFGMPISGSQVTARRNETEMLKGYDGLLTAIDQIAGVRIPASALESLVLKSRVVDYSPALLDRAISAGDVLWCGDGELSGAGWISLHLTEAAALTLPESYLREEAYEALGPLEHAIFEVLGEGGLFFPQLKENLTRYGQTALEAIGKSGTPNFTSGDISTALWNLVWAGLVTNDTFAPVRAILGGGKAAHKVARPAPSARMAGRRGAARLHSSRFGALTGAPVENTLPINSGRWSRVQAEELDPTIAATARAELLVDRYGVLTRGAVATEETPGGFSGIYKILSAAEEKGLARRGYFIEELGATQFSSANTVDRLRAYNQAREYEQGASTTKRTVVLLAATDPANPYGSTLSWPAPSDFGGNATKHKPGRKAGAVVVLCNGALALYLERGGKTALLFTKDSAVVSAVAPLVAELVHLGAAESLMLEKVNGVGILESPAPLTDDATDHPVTALRAGLLANGFYSTPKGVRIRKSF